MNTVMQFLQTTFSPLVLLFAVSNLAAMGLQVRLPEVMAALRSKKSVALIFVWGWVLGPAFGYLITRVLPLADPYVVLVLLASLAPCAPFLQQMVGKARGDMAFAGALIPIVAVGTVVLMPLMAPLLIKGPTIDTWALAKPLLLTILLPLIIGASIRPITKSGATRIFPAVKGLAQLSTCFGFGMNRNQRSVMALGMGTCNVVAVLATALAIPNADPRILTMVIMWTLWPVVLAAIGARIFAKQAGFACAEVR